MIAHTGRPRIWWPVLGVSALFAALGLLLIAAPTARAASVEVHDDAHVLNTEQVQNEAATLPDPIRIFTTNSFTGSADEFDQQTRDAVSDVNTLVINIDTVQRHIAIFGGKALPLTDSQYNDAVNAFRNAFGEGDYTGATIAAIDSLRDSLQSSSPNSGDNTGNTGTDPTNGDIGSGDPTTGIVPTTGTDFNPFNLLLIPCIGFVIVIGLIAAIVGGSRSRRRGPFDGHPPYGGFGGGSTHHSGFSGGSSFGGGNAGGGASGGFGGGNAGGGASGNF
ncbi:MAG TPA: TPM domain-containing protein [Ktedonobacterales bacterium]|jgi:uncharacterized membrane protein YgcG